MNEEMRAVLTDPNAPAHVVLGRAPAPRCNSDQSLVRVRAVSLNRGELFRAAFTTRLARCWLQASRST